MNYSEKYVRTVTEVHHILLFLTWKVASLVDSKAKWQACRYFHREGEAFFKDVPGISDIFLKQQQKNALGICE